MSGTPSARRHRPAQAWPGYVPMRPFAHRINGELERLSDDETICIRGRAATVATGSGPRLLGADRVARARTCIRWRYGLSMSDKPTAIVKS